MRDVLNYPQIDRSKVNIIKKLIDHIAENPNKDFSHELCELNVIAGKTLNPIIFFEYWGRTDLDTLAESVLIPEPPCVRDLSKDEMKEIVLTLKAAIFSLDDNKAEYYMEMLHKSFPLVNVRDYIRLHEEDETIVTNMLNASASSIIAL